MGQWLCDQQINYNKAQYNMKNLIIKTEWETFINDEKYKIYFK